MDPNLIRQWHFTKLPGLNGHENMYYALRQRCSQDQQWQGQDHNSQDQYQDQDRHWQDRDQDHC